MDNSRPTADGAARELDPSRFPLMPSLFPVVQCDDTQTEFLKREADTLVRDMVGRVKWEMRNEDSSRGWKLSSSKRHYRETGIRTYCRKSDVLTERKSRRLDFKCMGCVAMSLPQIMDALYSDNTLDFRHNAELLVDGCLDASVLHVVHRRTPSQPYRYLGLNWLAMRGTGMFDKKRDICYVRSTGITADAARNDIGYVVMRSIDLKECPRLEQSHGLARLHLSSAMLFRASANGDATDVIWQGSMALGGLSFSKALDFVHTTYSTCVSNLNVHVVTRYLTRDFGVVSAKRRATTLERETIDLSSSISEKDNVRRFCKKCVVDAKKRLDKARPTLLRGPEREDDDDDDGDDANSRLSSPRHNGNGDRVSTVSSVSSRCSINLFWDPSASGGKTSNNNNSQASAGSGQTTSTSTSTSSATSFSNSNIPLSPLSIKTAEAKKNKRDRLETDPWEHYDKFDGECSQTRNTSFNGRASTYSNESKDSDLAARLYEMSCRAQETLDTTRRNSCMMGSDSGSAPRSSEHRAFQHLDKSISEQADLLNVIGFVSTGRVYMENRTSDSGVRVSESSISDAERFEILT
ncbi:hypothetical protein P43SY_000985 [Pythium insidiosum]|uniref:START domain-containing protein n=1 Tax=Pythium insidiosum TaxID=114742 RepID=A0AAD5Q8N6_PYTIN|nr:hypothetical protein P43SY_000985 [Pythium insidiosum]